MTKRLLLIFLIACKLPGANGPGGPGNLFGKVELVQGDERFTQAGVKIVLEGLYTNVSESDESGAFRFEGVPAGKYTLRASFGEFTREGEVSSAIEIASGSETEAPALALTPAGSITGRARLGGRDTGNLGIRVSIDGTDIVTTTNDRGEFLISRVPVGSYRVRVEKSDYGGRTRRGIEVSFAGNTEMETIDIQEGIFSDFNNPPTFKVPNIVLTRGQVRPGTLLQPLPLDLSGKEAARFDTVRLDAEAEDIDGDRLTYFWSVTAGSLDHTDDKSALWTIDDDTALGATVTVRVVDERSGAAYLSAQLQIIDVQTLSARSTADSVIYAYRPFSGAWRVLEWSYNNDAPVRVAEIASLDDPKPMKLGAYYGAMPFSDGDRHFQFWQAGQTPTDHTVTGVGEGFPSGTRLVRMQQTSGKTSAYAYDPANAQTGLLFQCAPTSCGDLVSSEGSQVVSMYRDVSTDEVTLYTSGQHFSRLQGTGARVRSDGNALVFADVPPGYGRSGRNSVMRAVFPNGNASELYSGLYDVFIGAYSGRFLGFTEQEYRVVYSPEKAYLWDAMKNMKIEVDPSEDYAYDEVVSLKGRMLVRRYPRADWLRDEQRTHYELSFRPLPQ